MPLCFEKVPLHYERATTSVRVYICTTNVYVSAVLGYKSTPLGIWKFKVNNKFLFVFTINLTFYSSYLSFSLCLVLGLVSLCFHFIYFSFRVLFSLNSTTTIITEGTPLQGWDNK